MRFALPLLCLLLIPVATRAAPPGQALVIGEAGYTGFPPLRACALSANSVTAALRRLGFTVEQQNDASSGAIFAGIATLSRRLEEHPQAPVFIYVCSYATAFAERPFLLPVSATVNRPADVLTQGLLAKTLTDVVTANSKGAAVIALDAIPAPKAPADLAFDELATELPANVGLIALRDTARGDRPTPFAALLTPALKGPVVKSAKLLADLQAQITAGKTETTQIAALHLPDDGLYLAESLPAAAATTAATSTTTAAAATSLPDQSKMTDEQRRLVQRALAALGYYDGRIDGIIGKGTRAAIRRYQHELKQPMTGHLTTDQATSLVGG